MDIAVICLQSQPKNQLKPETHFLQMMNKLTNFS